MLKEFRKTETIKAEQFDGSEKMIRRHGITKETYSITGWKPIFLINVLGTDVAINIGDWIAEGVDGHWPIADDIFIKTYEEVE